ncbi:lysophospholipid acyltransferase family protein [Thermomonas hydrothermalis]|nr:lysophospholipid acyltransferase family protein [Thermomonas hydrothermalis]
MSVRSNDSAGNNLVPPLPPQAPRMAPSPWLEALGRAVLRLGGWRVEGAFPDLPRLVVIAAPHSSNWDGIWGFAAKLALGIRLSVLGKHTLMRIPLLSAFLRWQGVIGVDRAAPQGVVEQAIALLRRPGSLWYAIAPEGTRKPVARWKPGFWRIARGAGVPVLAVAFDYPHRRIVIGPVFTPGEDMDADIARIQRWYAPFKGRCHDVVQPG